MTLSWRALDTVGGLPGGLLRVDEHDQNIVGAFTTRLGGVAGDLDLSLRSTTDEAEVRSNRDRLCSQLGLPEDSWTLGEQVHGAGVHLVADEDRGAGRADHPSAIPGVDALWTETPGVSLVVLTADCVPILIKDPARARIAAVHAGWRGVVAGVIEETLAAFGATPTTTAHIGPSIGPCCYQVGDDVLEPAMAAFGDRVRSGDRLDLWTAARLALMGAGVRSIDLAALCTRCEPERFFSHRAGATGRQAAIIGMR
ncbi:MAG: peptidoglycan editing factor PgeF [Actinomycetota bacterium]